MTAPTVFISHANEDNATAKRLAKRLREDGFDPWLDEERLLPGQDWKLEIEKAMRASNAILVCFSEKSVSKSGFVQKEFKRALEIQEEKPEGSIFVIPVRFDKSEPPFSFREIQWVDYPANYDRLVLALNNQAGKASPAKPEGEKQKKSSPRKKPTKANAAEVITKTREERTASTQVDFLIVTALEKEAKAVVQLLDNHKIERDESKDIRTYHLGTIPIQNTNRSYQAVVVVLPSMGELPAAMAATDAIAYWNPRFVFMVGIAGGIPQDDLDLGDIVIADQVVGYDYGKATDEKIKPRDRVYPASALLLERVRNFWDETWAKQIHETRPGNAKRTLSKRFVGPIVSGNKVIASTKFRDSLLERWPKLIAVETESEGVYAAVFDRPQIRGTLVVRGICDMADERKGDEWQEYAADAAATYLIQFLKSGPVDQIAVTLPKPPSPSLLPDKISLAKLPSIDPFVIGREKELAELDTAWGNPHPGPLPEGEGTKVNIFTLIAWGGVGKSALVNAWLNGMARDNFRGAERVFGWSFYSQGAKEERQVSSEPFIASALSWFGDAETANSSKSSWEKGERLAELVRQQRTLLILDGLEPLQGLPDGEIRDRSSGLVALLRELAAFNPGLVVVSSRVTVADLKQYAVARSHEVATKQPPVNEGVASGYTLATTSGSVIERDLENLTDPAGAEYLRHLGVDGTDVERQAASHEFGGHALALTLLGRYLQVVYRGDVRKRNEIPRIIDEKKQGKQGVHARRVMDSYEHWLQGKPELDILHLLGLFDRPAEKGALDELRGAPAIPGLTDALQNLSDADWQFAVEHLRELRLLAPASFDFAQDVLDCHPLLREHFGEKLKADNPTGWRQGHLRLFIYYATEAKPFPNTIEEMAPLFAAVMHGCLAGKHQEAFLEVYWKRIARGQEFFSLKKLGAFGSDLAALSGFFDGASWRKPVDGLREDIKGFVSNQAGADLRALGRLAEAAQPMQAGLETLLAQKNWKQSAKAASNLSELTLTLGDVRQALDYAKQSVGLADQSGDEFQRMVSRTKAGDSQHQAGNLSKAQAAFVEAEEIQKKSQPEFQLLYSLQGFLYCDLLLSQGRAAEVERRARQTLEWAKQYLGLLDVALDHLSLGRARMALTPSSGHPSPEIGRGDGGEGLTYLNRAVEGLRKSGNQDDIPRGLLARAEYYRVVGDFEKAKRDLDEAFAIATRGGMGLFLADCHLGYARLILAQGGARHVAPLRDAPMAINAARQHVATAQAMIEKMGYHRRDPELAELESQLSAAG